MFYVKHFAERSQSKAISVHATAPPSKHNYTVITVCLYNIVHRPPADGSYVCIFVIFQWFSKLMSNKAGYDCEH